MTYIVKYFYTYYAFGGKMFIEFTTPRRCGCQHKSQKFSKNPTLCKKTLLFLLLAIDFLTKVWYTQV